jgi:hypothetical protein
MQPRIGRSAVFQGRDTDWLLDKNARVAAERWIIAAGDRSRPRRIDQNLPCKTNCLQTLL